MALQKRERLVGAEQFPDTVGIGSYRIDLHPSYRQGYIDTNNYPHQIPLGTLIPQRVENLLPACKNLGVTHITNGCYRLHPIEWNIGEVAACCLEHDLQPRQIRNTLSMLADFQHLLVDRLGFALAWPEELRVRARHKADPLGI